MEGIIKATGEVLAKSTYTDHLNKLRKHGRPVHVTKSIWARWNEAWGTAEFQARLERMSLNRHVTPQKYPRIFIIKIILYSGYN